MASGGDIHSILFRGNIFQEPLPKYDPSKKVLRYFPGQLPTFAEKATEEASSDSDQSEQESPTQDTHAVSVQERRLNLLENLEKEQSSSDGNSDVEENANKRIITVAKRKRRIIEPIVICHDSESKNISSHSESEAHLGKRLHLPAEPVVLFKSSEKESTAISEVPATLNEVDEETARELRRQRILERRRQEEILEVKKPPTALYGSEEESASGDEEEDDDEEEINVLRPVFIPASKRVLEKDGINKEENEFNQQEESTQKQKQKRMELSKKIIAETIQHEEKMEKQRRQNAEKSIYDPENMPSDSDDKDPEHEYELWKVRELKRILRNQKEEQQYRLEQEHLERRRNMTPQQLEKDNERLDAIKPKGEKKSKYQFLQKYYHQGAFFQDLAVTGQEPLYLRDYNKPVGEDLIDKKKLPAPLRVRRGLFGKGGQVKHTHLADVDTTDFTSSWNSKKNPVMQKMQSKLSKFKEPESLQRPSLKKKL